MNYFKTAKQYKTDDAFFTQFLNMFWFVPSDILQRGLEANIWKYATFTSPILSIGIGNGKLDKVLFKNKQQMEVGIDIEGSGLNEAKATGIYKKVECVNAEKMPYKDNSFATVVSNSTFEHIRNDLKAVSEVARVLKKGGLFFLTIPSNYLEDWIYEYEKTISPTYAKKKLSIFNLRTEHRHYRALHEWESYFKKVDLKIVFSQYYFPKNIALFWYKLFTFFTYKVKKRELWSVIGDSRLTKFFPVKIIQFLERYFLINEYRNGFFTDGKPGAQLFIVAQKA